MLVQTAAMWCQRSRLTHGRIAFTAAPCAASIRCISISTSVPRAVGRTASCKLRCQNGVVPMMETGWLGVSRHSNQASAVRGGRRGCASGSSGAGGR